MASFNFNFSDIRIIFCVQGYSLPYEFVLREIGFWTPFTSGSIPFNCKINLSNLDVQSLKTINVLEENIHGIKVKKNADCGLAISDAKAVLRTLYHMTSWKSNSNRIGICRDPNINGLLHKAGLGIYVVELDDLQIFKNTEDKVPSNKDLQLFMKNNPKNYTICPMHEALKCTEYPICAKVKAEFIADFCKNYQSNIDESLKSLLSFDQM